MGYWVSGIAYDEKTDRAPWLWSANDSCMTLEEAMELVEWAKKELNLISAWVDCYSNSNPEKQVVYNECFINVLGYRK